MYDDVTLYDDGDNVGRDDESAVRVMIQSGYQSYGCRGLSKSPSCGRLIEILKKSVKSVP
jgi:hypothetical protein